MTRYEWAVALRFLRFDRNQTLFILLAITLGVAVQIFLDSLITSLQFSLIDETIGASPHITAEGKAVLITSEDHGGPSSALRGDFTAPAEPVDNWLNKQLQLEAEPDLLNVLPVLEAPGFLERGGVQRNILLRGVELAPASRLYHLSERLSGGVLQVSGREILLGAQLAEDLSLGVGDTARLVLPGRGPSQWTVTGIVDFKAKGLNSSWIFADLAAVQSAAGTPDIITRFEAQTPDVYSADRTSDTLNRRYGSLKFGNWKADNAQLLIALQSQSSSSSTIQAFVLLSILMGISSVLGISVAQKNREIGILKAMGATAQSARWIFLIQGLVLGLAGAVAGCAAGWLLIQGFSRLGGGLSFTIVLSPGLIPRMLLITTLAGMISAWIPSNRSARLNPIEVIRNG